MGGVKHQFDGWFIIAIPTLWLKENPEFPFVVTSFEPLTNASVQVFSMSIEDPLHTNDPLLPFPRMRYSLGTLT